MRGRGGLLPPFPLPVKNGRCKLPEVVKCSKCGKSFKVKGFADQMAKIRHHYKVAHPTAFKKSIAKGVKTRKGK